MGIPCLAFSSVCPSFGRICAAGLAAILHHVSLGEYSRTAIVSAMMLSAMFASMASAQDKATLAVTVSPRSAAGAVTLVKTAPVTDEPKMATPVKKGREGMPKRIEEKL